MSGLVALATGYAGVLPATAGEQDSPLLAPTPPMGWNSWNCFAKDIDEGKIRAIADIMVSSGMRDAGYEFLVLDDAWMSAKRDADGRLQADPGKFPSGMKALGDYIHDKGLKYGIYQDRGVMTCQKLPGSLGHEDVDMRTFAEWGVDYIKMDSCFAENNGRTSWDDYDIFRAAIEQTGRPIVLSISDFGNAAWAWGGSRSAQLWRTSGDIRANMGSVYACAETSGGSARSHPAFNGLWQFAGPGRWNDPDMLQVGNFKLPEARREAADRAHFSLWCILAAPLMAGNDLREMNESVRQILTAPEVIAVNQDPRGLQGFKVRDDGDLEIYNKPLADGTTAVLLLNKGPETTDLTVEWKTIGLRGNQPVRDLWQRRDLGEFEDSFTARKLGQHGVRMLRVGRQGSPLPGPTPLEPERYRITRTGDTYLSDLCYIWLDKHPPKIDTTSTGDPIVVGGTAFKKGLGCHKQSSVMYMTDRRANRFRAVVAVDQDAQAKHGDECSGRFRVLDGDWFSNQVLWDSHPMKPGDAPKTIDIAITQVECLLLEFKGNNTRGCWASARVSTGR
jgi:alpha-galactosidase